MNYRHVFHAGNFADVVKHAVLARVLVALTRKETPIRYIETHAGAGRYDLTGPDASRSPEWRRGIKRILGATAPGDLGALLAPYLSLVEANNEGDIAIYPGSPAIARALLRRDDRLALCETQADTRLRLIDTMGRDPRSRIVELDGFMALNAFVPPKERRGAVLIDPPYELADERERVVSALAQAWRKWQQGVYLVWRPVFEGKEDAAFVQEVALAGTSSVLNVTLDVGRSPPPAPRLRNAGLLILNAPFGVFEEIQRILAFLTPLLACGPGATHKCEWVRPPK